MTTREIYGPGGYDPTKPNNNVISTGTSTDPPEQVVEETARADADQALDGLRLIANSTGTLTGAQLSNAVRLLARVAIRLARLQLRKLDAAD